MEIITIDGKTFEVSKCSRPMIFGGRTETTMNLVEIISIEADNNLNLFNNLQVGRVFNLRAKGKDYKVRLRDKDEHEFTLSFEIVS